MTPEVLRSPVFWLRLVSLCVVVSLALGLARLTWRVVGWDDGRQAVWTPAALPSLGGPSGGNLATILAYAPFGGGAGGAGGLAVDSLGLVLKGIVYQASGAGSAALIAAGDGLVQTFVVGQAPVGSVVIESIQNDHVVLSSGGRREILALPKPTGGAGSVVGTVPAPASAPVSTPSASPASEAALASSSPVATTVARATSQRTAQPAVASSPAMSASALGVSSTPQGYVVGADSAPQLIRAGLRPGDVIKSLNGQALGNPATDQQVFERAAAVGRARVEIIRDNRTVTLTIPLR
ncbi:type II secretion system protein N [Brevundimonas sp.]|uniref:type II secretion system protein N n=1 Tax=Brevundimonas sp. TaxID=1871086 RepID=UPI0035672C4A